jgi:hypothetical protein
VGFAILIGFFELSYIELDIGFSFVFEAVVLEFSQVEAYFYNVHVFNLLSFTDVLF